MKNRILLSTTIFMIIAISAFAQTKGTFTDIRDGKIYETVQIGTQTWMAENLAFKVDSGCWAYNNDMQNVKIYGYLYNWNTANAISPTGWHLPTDAEWTILTDYVGGKEVAAKELKSEFYWHEPNDVSDKFGFSGLPAGFRNLYGETKFLEYDCVWWSKTEDKTHYAWCRHLNYDDVGIGVVSFFKTCGFSVRCIKDE